MTFLVILAFQTAVVVGVGLVWYRFGFRAGFARGENRGIHYALSAVRDVLADDDEPEGRTH